MYKKLSLFLIFFSFCSLFQNDEQGVISVVDLNMGTLESEIPTNGFPLHLTSPPSGERVYATIANPETLQANEVSVFSVDSSSFIESIPVGNTINNIEIHPLILEIKNTNFFQKYQIISKILQKKLN